MQIAVEFMYLFNRTVLGQRYGEHDHLTLDSLSSQPSGYFSKHVTIRSAELNTSFS